MKRRAFLQQVGMLLSAHSLRGMPSISEEAKAVVRRNTDEVQGQGLFDVFEELFCRQLRRSHYPTRDHTGQGGREEALWLSSWSLSRLSR